MHIMITPASSVDTQSSWTSDIQIYPRVACQSGCGTEIAGLIVCQVLPPHW